MINALSRKRRVYVSRIKFISKFFMKMSVGPDNEMYSLFVEFGQKRVFLREIFKSFFKMNKNFIDIIEKRSTSWAVSDIYSTIHFQF